MKNRIMTVLLAMLLSLSVLLPSVSYADYGYTIPVNAVGTKSDIITIKRPESLFASTSDKTYTLSATCTYGTKVKIYKVTPNSSDASLVVAERAIGASGLYSTVVDLDSDTNTFMVYAENQNGSQVVNIKISKIKKSTIDRLKSLTVTIRNFFG